MYHDERTEWQMYAFDPAESAVMGKRKREWTAVAPTELDVLREMARCLRELGEGRAPKYGAHLAQVAAPREAGRQIAAAAA